MVHHVETLGDYSTDEWYTPNDPWIVGIKKLFGGVITLDPCSNEIAQSWINASVYWTLSTKIHPLNRHWGNKARPSKVYCNPPYLGDAANWITHAVQQYDLGHISDLVLLVRGDSKPLQQTLAHSDVIWCVPNKRIRFIRPDGTTGDRPKPGYKVIYLGQHHDLFYEIFRPHGNIDIPFKRLLDYLYSKQQER